MAPSAVSPEPASLPTTSSSLTSYRGYDHVHWYVGNATQAASFYVARLGFERVAYRGLETGSRALASHVVRGGGVTFVLTSPLRGLDSLEKLGSEEEKREVREVVEFLEKHGDGVKGQSFS